MENRLEKRIKNIIAAVFEIAVEQIKDDSSPDTIESWDSLKHMNLVVALEEEFSITFNDQQIYEMLNYTLIVNIIRDLIE